MAIALLPVSPSPENRVMPQAKGSHSFNMHMGFGLTLSIDITSTRLAMVLPQSTERCEKCKKWLVPTVFRCEKWSEECKYCKKWTIPTI